MTAEEVIDLGRAIFGPIERPEHFTNHKHCCECAEHDAELLGYTPDSIPRKALGTMGWDPITFTSDHGFRYYLPGLIRIVLSETGDNSYLEQFLWHTLGDAVHYDRYPACSQQEREVVWQALNCLLETRAKDIEDELLTDDLLCALEKWSAGVGKQ